MYARPMSGHTLDKGHQARALFLVDEATSSVPQALIQLKTASLLFLTCCRTLGGAIWGFIEVEDLINKRTTQQ